MSTFRYGIDRLTPGVAIDLAGGKIQGVLTEEVMERVQENKTEVDRIVQEKKTVYGINTGFGPLCTQIISEKDTQRLQYNLLLSHAVGVGEPIPENISRMMLIMKLHALAIGYSGVSPLTLERIHWHIQQDAIPCVPAQGSVGASGDLAPLAHLFLPLIGQGKLYFKGRMMPANKLLDQFGLKPLILGPKEGLALINGTQFMTAHCVEFIKRFQNCLDHADIIAAINFEAMMGSVRSFDHALQELRPFQGSVYVASRMRHLIGNSEIVESHKNCSRVQDPYSLRCIPQVHGASRNAYVHLKELLITELNSVTDNPIVFSKNKAVSGGNFHGQLLALPVDYAAFAASELGNIADRRIYLSLMNPVSAFPDSLLRGKRTQKKIIKKGSEIDYVELVNSVPRQLAARSFNSVEGLPKLLMKDTGFNSGLMIPQYTTAALVNENKTLCYPASADSIPTSLGQEDHVSMGANGVRKALRIVENVERILGIELFCAAQGFDFRKPLRSGPLVEVSHKHIRSRIPHIDRDVYMGDYIQKATEMIKKQELTRITGQHAEKHGINFINERHELFGIY